MDNITFLEEHGPTAKEDLPQTISLTHKQKGLTTLQLKASEASDLRLGGQQTTIAYLFDEHGEENVIRVYLEENPSLIENQKLRYLIRRFGNYGQSWKEAAQKVCDEMGLESSHSGGGPVQSTRPKYPDS